MRAVLFDAAGTLIRLREPVGETYTRLARGFGVTLAAAPVEDAFRRVFRSMPPMVFRGAQSACAEREWWREVVRRTFSAAAPDAEFDDFAAYFDLLFGHYGRANAWSAAPGAHEALAGLRARTLRTGVVSNFDHRLNGILDELKLSPLLDVIVRPANAGAAKPDPRIFAFALDRLAVSARESAYVGDDAEDDAAGAAAAGLMAIDVNELGSLFEIVDTV